MGESMTSRDDAAIIRAGLVEAVTVLERNGFSRGEIGACMAGIGLAMTQVHIGTDRAMKIMDRLRGELNDAARDAVQ